MRSFRTYWEHVLRFNLVWTLRRSSVSLKKRNFYVNETLINIKQHRYCRTGNSYINTVSICFTNFRVPIDSLRKMDFGEICCCRMNTKWNRILLRDFVRSVMNVRTVSQIICCYAAEVTTAWVEFLYKPDVVIRSTQLRTISPTALYILRKLYMLRIK